MMSLLRSKQALTLAALVVGSTGCGRETPQEHHDRLTKELQRSLRGLDSAVERYRELSPSASLDERKKKMVALHSWHCRIGACIAQLTTNNSWGVSDEWARTTGAGTPDMPQKDRRR